MSNIITAVIISIIAAVFLISSSLVLNKFSRVAFTEFSTRNLFIDSGVTAIVIFCFQILALNFEINSMLIIFLAVSCIALYPNIIQPYRLVNRYLYRDKKMEMRLTMKSGLKVPIVMSPKKFNNAVAFGVLPFSRVIVISKELNERLSSSQLEAIVLHEAAHIKYRHVLIVNLFNITTAFIQAVVLSLMLKYNVQDNILIYLGCLSICALFLYFAPALIYRRFELRADKFASVIVGKDTYTGMLNELDAITSLGLTNNDFYHPSLKTRISNVER